MPKKTYSEISSETKLLNYVCWQHIDSAKDLLEKNRMLDVTYRDGEYFIISIQDNSFNIAEALLNHFKEYQLDPLRQDFEKYEETQNIKYQDNYVKYATLLQKIRNILEVAIEDVTLSEEMQKVLSKYLEFGDEQEDDITTLDLLDEDSSTFTDNSAMKYAHHRSSEEKDRDSFMNEENQRNSEESLNTHYEDELFIQLIGHIHD